MFYIRKVINRGNVRINVSKSGIGFSIGNGTVRIGTTASGKKVRKRRRCAPTN